MLLSQWSHRGAPSEFCAVIILREIAPKYAPARVLDDLVIRSFVI